MCGIARIDRLGGRRARPGGHSQAPEPGGWLDPWAEENPGAGACAVAGPLSFWRIVPVPFGAWVAALDRWQLIACDGQLRLGRCVLCGPAEYDSRFGTCRMEVRLAREPLRPRVRMQLHIDHWSAAATAVELIPCGHVRPSAAYFRAGRALLDALACAVAASAPVSRRAVPIPRQPTADQAEPMTAMPGSPATRAVTFPARQEAS